MSSTAKLPTRPRTTGASRRGSLLELVDRKRKPPTAPRSLGTPERAVWRELWREPVSVLWRETDRSLVLRLILLRLRLEREGADSPGWVYSCTSSLEDRLLLNPRARRAAGVVYVEPPPPAESKNGVRRLDARRRERLARGA